jgi:hypothetical protein
MRTGRGNADLQAIEKTKEFLRKKHPEPVRAVELARYINKPQARALRILDLLSGVSNDIHEAEFLSRDFLVYIDDDSEPVRYGIFKDSQNKFFII